MMDDAARPGQEVGAMRSVADIERELAVANARVRELQVERSQAIVDEACRRHGVALGATVFGYAGMPRKSGMFRVTRIVGMDTSGKPILYGVRITGTVTAETYIADWRLPVPGDPQ